MSTSERGPGARYRELGRNPALDGFRGLAVLLVICDHAHIPMGATTVATRSNVPRNSAASLRVKEIFIDVRCAQFLS